jgi:hypothetical protein
MYLPAVRWFPENNQKIPLIRGRQAGGGGKRGALVLETSMKARAQLIPFIFQFQTQIDGETFAGLGR